MFHKRTERWTGLGRERISLILELRVMLLSFHIGFNLVNAAVVCALLAHAYSSYASNLLAKLLFCYYYYSEEEGGRKK